MNFPEFEAWPKIPRLRRECVITEKIDGTNGQLFIRGSCIYVGSRNRWLGSVRFHPEAEDLAVVRSGDNYGFLAWVEQNYFELFKLGEGRFYGEWYGKGIQRGYGLDEKRFALFNRAPGECSCVSVVPFIVAANYTDGIIELALDRLRSDGSLAVPGFRRPEGVVVNFPQAKTRFKVLLENDDKPKGQLPSEYHPSAEA